MEEKKSERNYPKIGEIGIVIAVFQGKYPTMIRLKILKRKTNRDLYLLFHIFN